MQCPRCQHENAPTMKCCGECGTPLRTANPEARVDPDAVDRRLGAILSADAVGYGGLMARDDVATLRTLTAYREQITVLVRQHRGRLVDAPGDNLLAEFPSALEATRCALEIQRVLAARNAGLPAERRMAFRVGVHLGDVLVEGDRIYVRPALAGASVSRLCSACSRQQCGVPEAPPSVYVRTRGTNAPCRRIRALGAVRIAHFHAAGWAPRAHDRLC
jgi:class 3 adenylate cyclase